MPIKMATLQELAMKHTLPAIVIRCVPKTQLGKDLQDKLLAVNNGVGNDELYQMFARSMEARGDVSFFIFLLSLSSFFCLI